MNTLTNNKCDYPQQINSYHYVCVLHPCPVVLDVYSVLFPFSLTTCACVCNSWSIAGMPSSQALPGFLITAPPSLCVPDVIGTPVVWIPNQTKEKNTEGGWPATNQRRREVFSYKEGGFWWYKNSCICVKYLNSGAMYLNFGAKFVTSCVFWGIWKGPIKSLWPLRIWYH